MKSISSLVRSFLSSGSFSSFILLTMYAPGATRRYTSLPYSVTIDGNLYDTDNNLVSVDPPKVAINTDRAAYKVVFADPERGYASICDTLVNSKISVKAGFHNTSGAAVVVNSVTYQPGDAVLDESALFTVYSGRVEKASYAVNEEDGVLFVIDCGSPMINLDTVNAFYTTKDALRQRTGIAGAGNTDTAFDYVTMSGIRRSVQWGKV